MNTNPKLDIDRFFESVVTSYEERIQKIQTAFQSSENISESSHTLFDNVHDSLNDLKKERNILNSKLCETLAKNDSLRKLVFIETPKETAQSLKNSLSDIKDMM